MKRLLLATAAVIALAVVAPIATAQYTSPPPATAPYSTPLPDDPTTPQDEALAEQDTTANQPAPPGATEAPKDPVTAAMPQPELVQTETPDSMQAQTEQDVVTAEQEPPNVADSSLGANVATPASLDQHARDAGMDGLPMTAQEVCAPREIALTTSGANLSRDKEHLLINAADRASVCQFQSVVINSPNGRADEARQLLIDSGVDASLIEVQDSDASGLDVELNFAGVATSSEQYAQMFNPQQLASLDPSTTPTAPSYQPSPSAPALPDEQNAPVDETDEDAMSPTSGNSAAKPGVLDT